MQIRKDGGLIKQWRYQRSQIQSLKLTDLLKTYILCIIYNKYLLYVNSIMKRGERCVKPDKVIGLTYPTHQTNKVMG